MLERYIDQVQLLVDILPQITKETAFALKGGTAINLFHRDMPRLSVDIDLTYLPVEDRDTSLRNMDATLDRIMATISNRHRGLHVRRAAGGGGGDTRIMVGNAAAQIKIETSPVMRGTVLPPVIIQTSDAVTDQFGFVEMQVVSFADLYGGKLHAALDRQHPRDLFDVKLLYEHEGLGDELFRVFLVYVASSNRPMHELLAPAVQPIADMYHKEFAGMTRDDVSLAELERTREKLHLDVHGRLTGKVATFLLSLHDGEPDFDLIGLPAAHALPAVQWKLLNLGRLKNDNPGKHAEQRRALQRTFAQRND